MPLFCLRKHLFPPITLLLQAFSFALRRTHVNTKPQSRAPSPRRRVGARNKNNVLKNNAKDPLPNPPPQAGEGIFSKTWGNVYVFESELVLYTFL